MSRLGLTFSALMALFVHSAPDAQANSFHGHRPTTALLTTIHVGFNDGAGLWIAVKGDDITSVESAIDGTSGCEPAMGAHEFTCSLSGPAGTDALPASLFNTYAYEVHYDDSVTPESGSITAGATFDTDLTLAFTVPPGTAGEQEDFINDVVNPLGQLECTYWICSVWKDEQDNIVGCGGTTGSCQCVNCIYIESFLEGMFRHWLESGGY